MNTLLDVMEYNKEISNNQNNQTYKINCTKCLFFSITWDKTAPRACSIFNFKGYDYPSKTVLEVTGKNCISFKPKKF